MSQEQSWLLLYLCNVGVAASWLSTLLGPMAKLATVVAGVISCRLLVAGGASARATLSMYLRPGLGASVRLVLLAVLAAARRGRGLPLLPVTLAGLPLFPSEMKLPADGDRPRERLWFITIDDLEATYCLFHRHRGEIQQRLDRASDLLVLVGDASEALLDNSLLAVGVVTELHHPLLQSVKTESKVINVLTWLEGQVLQLFAKCLQRGFAGAVVADACRSDGVPSLLGSPLLRKRELHLVVIDVAVPNCFPHVPHLEPYPHHRGPLDVVGLGEGRTPAAGTDVPDNSLDPM
jgi:hypothetical protein